MKTTWVGNCKCDFCGKEITDVLIDGKTELGPWATMCLDCYSNYGIGLGCGKGQQYICNADGEFVKAESKSSQKND